MKVPEKYRVIIGKLATDSSYGNNGLFVVPLSNRTKATVIASDGEGWEHASVVITSDGKQRTATWYEMCKIKEMFWSDDETVVQFHPKKTEYVNNHKYCLHLWKQVGVEIQLPNSILIGIKRKKRK